ncbi:hypothetical protein AXF42_Ash018466 [Apostasia shenzhenica]|uniref:Uncharacterized protein n=1 Tax=Apostasia shenzhenica TaxID=1088818 RepID=A0A2H9ZZC1_9ASPA|nr:hypothetical protein AXF42_Ash018466 [Apostasia shenzhenica]
MEAVSISSSLLPLSNASLQNNSRSRTTSLMLSSHLKLRTHPSLAAADVLHSTAAAAAPRAPGSGGDIAVLLPVG